MYRRQPAEGNFFCETKETENEDSSKGIWSAEKHVAQQIDSKLISRKHEKMPRLLTTEEEKALVAFIQYVAHQGFPITRTMVRCYVQEILKGKGRETANVEQGPSHKWFRALMKLSERTPGNLDKSRARMSSQKTMDGWFNLLESILVENGLKNKESQILNVNETGWSGKERSRTKVPGQNRDTFSQIKT